MRYFPLIPRLKRLYMSSKTAEDMRWYFNRKDDKILRHPIDGEAWKKFDEKYTEFVVDPRGVRLGLASDARFGGKIIYLGYRKWLPIDHPYRSQDNLFDGKEEYGTLLDMDNSRDNESGREALKNLNIKPHLGINPQGYIPGYIPPAAYTMSNEEKERFLKVLKKMKVLDGYGSNMQRCVNLKQRKLINMKSHGHHILMKDILPVALRALNATKVIDLLEELYFAFLKPHVSNKAQPEGSIAEGYLLWETIAFCLRYLESVETMFNRPRRNEDGVSNIDNYLYNSGGRVVGKKENVCLDDRSLKQAHRYVLLHSDELTPVHNLDNSTIEGKLRKALAGGLSNHGKRMNSVIINGYNFDIVDRERFRITQNSGIMVEAEGHEYYGKLKEILELDYYGSYKVVLFRCDWVDIRRATKSPQTEVLKDDKWGPFSPPITTTKSDQQPPNSLGSISKNPPGSTSSSVKEAATSGYQKKYPEKVSPNIAPNISQSSRPDSSLNYLSTSHKPLEQPVRRGIQNLETALPDWPLDIDFDDKEEVLTTDVDALTKMLKDPNDHLKTYCCYDALTKITIVADKLAFMGRTKFKAGECVPFTYPPADCFDIYATKIPDMAP
uniref:DUF4218 domain-containing protein n=1 Tax=Chenopodium quinoa TaxID=63459 RepID=A0A803N0T6_CHEQI